MMKLKKIFLKSAGDYRRNWKGLLIITLYVVFWFYVYSCTARYIGNGLINLLFLTPLYVFLTISGNYYCLKIARGEKTGIIEAVLKGITEDTGKLLIMNFLTGLFGILWSLLLIIPGIVKGIAYSQANYVFLENPDLSGKECIGKSEYLMEGEKERYFFMYGWVFVLPVLIMVLLSIITAVFINSDQALNYLSKTSYAGMGIMFFYPFYTLLSANFYVCLTDGDVKLNDEETGKDKWFMFGVLIISLLMCIIVNMIPVMELFYQY